MATDLARVAPELWRFGTQHRTARGTPIALHARVSAAAGARRYSTLRQFRATAGFQVSTGRTLVITRLIVQSNIAAMRWSFVDGTDDVGLNSAAAPAGAVDIDATFGNFNNPVIIATADAILEVEYYLEVPAGRFLAATHNNGSQLLIVGAFGVEV